MSPATAAGGWVQGGDAQGPAGAPSLVKGQMWVCQATAPLTVQPCTNTKCDQAVHISPI